MSDTIGKIDISVNDIGHYATDRPNALSCHPPPAWRLAPAFDLNPNPSKRHHALRLSEASDEPDIGTVLSTAEFYRVNTRDAQRILAELLAVTRSWRKRAKAARVPASEIARIEPAFALGEKG